MSKRFDVVVVGGGLGGLMCAAMIAREGSSVRVLERASHVGGRAMSPRGLNLGAHALYAGGPAQRVLAALGVSYRGHVPSASSAWLTDSDGVFASPTSIVSLATSRMFTFGERVSLMKFFAMLETSTPPKGATTTAWLDGLAMGPRARRFIDAMVRVATYSNMPDALPAEIAALQLQRAIGIRSKGVLYVDDGWQSLVDATASVATRAGVVIETNTEVHSIDALDAAHVVIALPREQASRLVPEITCTTPRVYAACLDMTLDTTDDTTHKPLSKRLVFGLEEPHYFSVHSKTTAHALRYLAPGEEGAECKERLEAWLAKVVPDLDARVTAKRFLPEMEVASALPSRDAVPALDRVSFVGDWTSATYQLLDAVAESVETVHARLRAERAKVAA